MTAPVPTDREQAVLLIEAAGGDLDQLTRDQVAAVRCPMCKSTAAPRRGGGTR